jgi:hypothetical protein
MVQTFRDASRAAYQRGGLVALVMWWGVTLFDLFRTVIDQQRVAVMQKFNRTRTAGLISLALCLPFFLFATLAVNNVDLPWLQVLMLDTPTVLGRVVMLVMMLGLPAAFIVNLLAMVGKASPEAVVPFRPTAAHTLIGLSVLVVIGLLFSEEVLYELRPFVAPLGARSAIGQVVFLLGLLLLPAAFLLNRLPLGRITRLGGVFTFQPTSVNLVIGAVVLLLLLMLMSSFVLEAVACAGGVPNCD